MATVTPPADPKTNWAEVGWKVLSLLILPLLGLGMTMYADASVVRERITQMQSQQAEHRTQIESVNTHINAIAMTVQETNGQVRELRTVLDIIRGQVTRSSRGNSP